MLLVRKLLKQQGITTKALSEKLGMTQSGLNQAIAGNPSLKVINKIADAMGVPVWQLFADEAEASGNAFIAFLHIAGRPHTPATPSEVLQVIHDECPQEFCSECIPFALNSIRTRFPAHHEIISTTDRLAELISQSENARQQ